MSKTMLIIEDDVVIRDLLRLVFEYDGFDCKEAEWDERIGYAGISDF
jgi:DNA-binding response OmpR family regulator